MGTPSEQAAIIPKGARVQQDPAQLWQSALRYLRQHVSEANYQTWLADTEGVRLDGSTLIIGTRSEFVTEWLQQRLRPLMLRTLTDLADRPIEVAFEPLRPPADDSPLLQRSGVPDAGRPSYPRPRLHARYVFDTFIVGPGNRLAFAAAEGVAASPGTLHNPLFLYGAVGLGKTHLLQGIGHRLVKEGRQITYISAEQFTNDLVTAIQKRTQEEFRARYRSTDALLIDDIQFVGGKEATQEELFHTFNSLYEAECQIVITSDKSPVLIPDLEERLRSRFEWGMTADIQAPDLETRVAILRSKAEEQRLRIDDDALHVIARRFTNNIRELEGSLTRVVAYSRLTGERIEPALVQSALASLDPTEPRLPPSPEVILSIVCRYFEIDREALLSKSREKRVAYPRQLAMYLMRELAHRSLAEIGQTLGGRDHSTVHHGWSKMERSVQVDPETKRDIGTLRELVERAREVA